MFSFFAFLILGSSCLVKLANEKGQNIKFDQELAKINKAIKCFDEIAGTLELGTEGKRAQLQINFMMSRPYAYADEIFKDLHDDLVEIYGKNYREKLPLDGYWGADAAYENIEYAKDCLSALWLSKRGKIHNEWNLIHEFKMSYNDKYKYKVLRKVQENLQKTAGQNPNCPEIKIVEVPVGSNSDWKFVKYCFEHTLFPSAVKRYI